MANEPRDHEHDAPIIQPLELQVRHGGVELGRHVPLPGDVRAGGHEHLRPALVGGREVDDVAGARDPERVVDLFVVGEPGRGASVEVHDAHLLERLVAKGVRLEGVEGELAVVVGHGGAAPGGGEHGLCREFLDADHAGGGGGRDVEVQSSVCACKRQPVCLTRAALGRTVQQRRNAPASWPGKESLYVVVVDAQTQELTQL